jgi:hypothetical protein
MSLAQLLKPSNIQTPADIGRKVIMPKVLETLKLKKARR